MTPPRLITPPAETPVSLAELKPHVRVTFDDDDAHLQSLLDGAVGHLDGWSGVLGRCMVTQAWRQTFECWGPRLRLPFPDVSNVAITYLDAAGATQAVDAADYAVVETARTAEIRFWGTFGSPTLQDYAADRIMVTFDAGYGASSAVPQAIKSAIMMLAAHWYEHREAAMADALNVAPLGFDALIAPYRRVWF